MPSTTLDTELVRRHNVNGPRYTSYPTANQFQDGDWIAAYQAALANENLSALSLYLHVPFCSTICFYCACNKINTANVKRADSYVRRLVREMELHSRLVDKPHSIEQLHIGGGTPTFLSDEQFARLFEAMHNNFILTDDDDRDYSIEIDPRGVSYERIANLAALGINRMSIGVQDFDPAVQLAVNRMQSVEETQNVIAAARANGVRSINIDLITGLPKQTTQGFSRTLEQVLELQPDRLSMYSYAHLPQRFKTQRQIDVRELPGAEGKLQLQRVAIDTLIDAGYEYVGMDHFARRTDALIKARDKGTLHRNFQGYTTHGHCELISFGTSSIGNIGRVYVQNTKTIHDYYKSIDAGKLAIERGLIASHDDVIVGQVIQDLMCRFEIDYERFEKTFGHEFEQYFQAQWPELQRLQSDELVRLQPDRLQVTKQGRFLIRGICMVFDNYLVDDREAFSKAI